MNHLTQSSAVVVDTSNSPLARLRPVPLTAVTLNDTFWAPRQRVNREWTLATDADPDLAQMVDTVIAAITDAQGAGD